MKIFGTYSRPISFIWKSFSGHKKILWIFLFSKGIESIFYIILPILAKLEMDQLAEKSEQLFGFIEASSFNIFIIILIIIFVGQFVESILRSIINLLENNYLSRYNNFYLTSLHERLRYAEVGIFMSERNKRMISEILENSTRIQQMISWLFGNGITNIFVLAGVIFVFSSINIWIFVILIVVTIVMYFLDKLREIIKIKWKFQQDFEFEDRFRLARNQLTYWFPELMASGGVGDVIKKYHRYAEELREFEKKREKKIIFIDIFSFVADNVSEILIKIIVGWSIFFAGTSLGTMTMTLLYTSKISQAFNFFRRLKIDMSEVFDELEKLDIFLSITEKTDTKQISEKNFAKISFENVKFSYPNLAKYEVRFLEIIEKRLEKLAGNNQWDRNDLHAIQEAKKDVSEASPVILEKVNLTFEVGKTYGLVGKNGAGKTTLTSLLQGFFHNYSGKILIDNEEIREFSREFFEKNISIINQIPHTFVGFTIRENLTIWCEKSYSDEEIFELLEKFWLAKKIKKLRAGLETELNYQCNFSGGEKQLIVLARIILQDKKILIMDEWTNQLDAENEMLVMNELLKHKKDKIVIFITHRMTTIRKVDKIYTLKDGKIEASGTHDELIGGDNMYNFFWKTQVEV